MLKYIKNTLKIVFGLVRVVYEKKGKGEFGRAGRLKGKESLQGDHCFLHFSHSDSEREYLFPIG